MNGDFMEPVAEHRDDTASKGGAVPIADRVGYIVWVSDHRSARNLDKYGTVHYISRRMNYAVVYMDADKAEDMIRNIERLPYVRKIERSYRSEIRTEYNKNVPDKTRTYSI